MHPSSNLSSARHADYHMRIPSRTSRVASLHFNLNFVFFLFLSVLFLDLLSWLLLLASCLELHLRSAQSPNTRRCVAFLLFPFPLILRYRILHLASGAFLFYFPLVPVHSHLLPPHLFASPHRTPPRIIILVYETEHHAEAEAG
jgi:hypothetical protein